MYGKQLQAAYSTRIMKENVQWIQKGLFFATILFLCQYRVQPPYSRELHYLLSKKKRMVTLNGSNIQLLTMLPAKPGKQKIFIKACLDVGDLEQIDLVQI